MDTKSKSSPRTPGQAPESKIDEIFDSVWEIAVHKNPMCLLNMVNPDSAFNQLRAMIRDCLAKGLSEVETSEHVLKELLQASATSRLPASRCEDSASPGSSPGQLPQ